MVRQSISQQVTGFITLALGVGFLLQVLGVISFSSYLAIWWPLILVIIGLTGIITDNNRSSLVLTVIGGLLLLSTLGYVTVSVWSLFWPLMLVFIGISLLLRWPRRTMSSSKRIDAMALFSGVERRFDTSDFEGGSLTVIFGGVELDLRKTTLAKDAAIDVFTAFGGAEITVPDDCQVIFSGIPIFGGWEDKTVQTREPKQTLIIRGTSIFGGISIKN